jgi:diguanylate cyclase (GGDEF)-like protein
VYNEKLAFAILLRLNEEFPRKVQMDDLCQALPGFSNFPTQEWMIAMDALMKLGRAQAGAVLPGMGDVPDAIANIEITSEGRKFLGQSQHVSDGESGDIDDTLPLFAKRQFQKHFVVQAATATASAPLSVLFVDIDHFKSVNDTFNHLIGNEVLIETATVLKAACEKKGRCYRWGGDELAVLLPNYNLNEAGALAERVRQAISQAQFKNYPQHLTAGIGVATYPETSGNADDLLRDADIATLAAKEAGKDQVCLAKRASEADPVLGISKPRISAAEISARVDAARVMVSIEHGLAASFLLNVRNDSDDEITVSAVELMSKDDIRLTTPGLPAAGQLWRFPPRVTLPIAWRAQPDPVGALVKMNSNVGAQFETELRIIFSIELLGKTKRCECKLWVRVDAFQGKIIQLAGS